MRAGEIEACKKGVRHPVIIGAVKGAAASGSLIVGPGWQRVNRHWLRPTDYMFIRSEESTVAGLFQPINALNRKDALQGVCLAGGSFKGRCRWPSSDSRPRQPVRMIVVSDPLPGATAYTLAI